MDARQGELLAGRAAEVPDQLLISMMTWPFGGARDARLSQAVSAKDAVVDATESAKGTVADQTYSTANWVHDKARVRVAQRCSEQGLALFHPAIAFNEERSRVCGRPRDNDAPTLTAASLPPRAADPRLSRPPLRRRR